MMSVEDRLGGPLLDVRDLDWSRVERVQFSLRQRFRYDYDAPIDSLRHRLMVHPPAQHGDQRLLEAGMEVVGADVVVREEVDWFGNRSYEVLADRVKSAVEFEVWATVDRRPADGPTALAAAALVDLRLLQPSPLTWPDAALEAAAGRLARRGKGGLALARRINTWVHQVMRYRQDVTNIDTTASRALGLAQGVCQDYAHVMLAICRLSGLPARYVSGHLLGEGGSHAWVEVVVPDPDGSGGAVAVPFDPTHGREVGCSYLTVAVGRDYHDVAPTYGTFQGAGPGTLTTVKRLGVSEVDVLPA
jgi:transglutaminase-like putative cysteine protease